MEFFYKEFGEGIPVLCLHGYTLDHRVMLGCLEPIFQNLTGYRRIYLDLPGMGKTPASPDVKNADDMLGMILAFIEKVIGKEKFLLVGESYGGYLSLGLIHLQQQIEGLFLIAPCVIADMQKRELPTTQDMDVYITQTNDMRERYENEIQTGLALADKEFTTKFRQEGYSFSFADEIFKLQFNKPTCITLGRQDETVGYMDALGLIKNFTRATFLIADSASHNLQIERVKLFNACFIDWLGRTGE